MSGWKGGLEPGKLKLNLMTLGFQRSFKERGVEISHLLSSYDDMMICSECSAFKANTCWHNQIPITDCYFEVNLLE